MGWDTSTRRQRLPKDWRQRRAMTLRRDPTCRICNTNPSTEVDHINAGDDHSWANLQGVCTPCHRTKSAHEGNNAKPQRRRTREPHPGDVSRGGG